MTQTEPADSNSLSVSSQPLSPVEQKQYVQERGDDLPEVKNWSWPY